MKARAKIRIRQAAVLMGLAGAFLSVPGGAVAASGAPEPRMPAAAGLVHTANRIGGWIDREIAALSPAYTSFRWALRQSMAGDGGIDFTTTGSVAGSFFGTVAIPFGNIRARADWDRVRAAAVGADVGANACADQACLARKAALLDAARPGRPFGTTLRSINSAVNRTIAYVADRKNYGTLDHWAAGPETIVRGRGDCEDFAILKYGLLVKAGIPARSLSLVVLKDNDRNLYHAVLAVSTNKGHFILDNLRDDVYADSGAKQYQPLFSFSADRSWIHGIPASAGAQNMARASVPLGAVAPGEGSGDGLAPAAPGPAAWDGLEPRVRF